MHSRENTFGDGRREVEQRGVTRTPPARGSEPEQIRLPVELLVPLRNVGKELVDMVRGYAACVESIDRCRDILDELEERWPQARRQAGTPPDFAYWRVVEGDVRLDELRRAVASLPQQLEPDEDRPHDVVDRVEALLDEVRREAQAGRLADAGLDWQRLYGIESKLKDARQQLARLARAIRAVAEQRGVDIQVAVAEIFRLIDRHQEGTAGPVENRSGSRGGRWTMGDTYMRRSSDSWRRI